MMCYFLRPQEGLRGLKVVFESFLAAELPSDLIPRRPRYSTNKSLLAADESGTDSIIIYCVNWLFDYGLGTMANQQWQIKA